MKAIVKDRYGSADVLELREVADPVLGDDEALIRVRAAGCGPDVWHMTTGEPYFMRGVPQRRGKPATRAASGSTSTSRTACGPSTSMRAGSRPRTEA